LDPIVAIARRHRLVVIEDAAQAHGAEYKGRRAGSMGDLACFSFYPGKNLGAYGEGGMVTTANDDYARTVRMLRDWGAEQKYQHVLKGYNYRLEGMQGAILRVKLRHLEGWTEARRAAAGRYDRLLARSGVCTPIARDDVRHVYHLYVVRTPARAAWQATLLEQGIQTAIHYPAPVHLLPAFADLGYRRQFPRRAGGARVLAADVPGAHGGAGRTVARAMAPGDRRGAGPMTGAMRPRRTPGPADLPAGTASGARLPASRTAARASSTTRKQRAGGGLRVRTRAPAARRGRAAGPKPHVVPRPAPHHRGARRRGGAFPLLVHLARIRRSRSWTNVLVWRRRSPATVIGDHVCVMPAPSSTDVVVAWTLSGERDDRGRHGDRGELLHRGGQRHERPVRRQGALVGLGSNVIRSVPAGARVAGNPARRI
jgi:hypothetical protein